MSRCVAQRGRGEEGEEGGKKKSRKTWEEEELPWMKRMAGGWMGWPMVDSKRGEVAGGDSGREVMTER